MKTIYLAGPEVFLPNAIEIGERKKILCQQYGFIGLFPLDNAITPKSTPYEFGLAISQANEILIQKADIIIANLTPFRGPSADVGTVYELGYARGLNKTIHAYTNVAALFTERTIEFVGLEKNVPTHELRDHNKLAIEQFEMHDNLMLDGALHLAQGLFVVENTNAAMRYTDLTAFETILTTLASSKTLV